MTEPEIVLLRDGAEAFPEWLAAIRAAKREIFVEMYWFGSDRFAQRLAEALCERARAGTDVRLVYDAIGSLGTDRAIFERLREAGAEVHEYNPVAPWRRAFRFARVFRRDHRKLIVVDSELAFIGGINVTDHEAPLEEGGAGWRDDCARFSGPAALDARRLFLDLWTRRVEPRRTASVPAFGRSMGAQWRGLTRRSSRADPILAAPIQVLGHPVRSRRRNLRRLYLFHIRAARRVILIQNAYFIPDGRVRRALCLAAQRGVEVRILVPRDSDIRAVQRASEAIYGPLLRAGVSIHEWVGPMMHAKTALIDGWATTGSFNLDRRSLRFNLELNVASTAPAFVAAVEASVRRDLERSVPIDAGAWARRSPWRRFVSWLYYQFRGLL